MTTRIDLLNALARRIGARSYLEIGVQGGIAFGQVDVARKVGVDPDPSSAASIIARSDDYFSSLPAEERFDLIFVDGLHHADQVERDILHGLRHISPGGAMVVHDCDPPHEAAGSRTPCPGVWCGDVWRGWMSARILVRDRYLAVVDTDLGCGVILPGRAEVPTYDLAVPSALSFGEFRASREEYLNLVSVSVFRLLLGRLQPIVQGASPADAPATT